MLIVSVTTSILAIAVVPSPTITEPAYLAPGVGRERITPPPELIKRQSGSVYQTCGYVTGNFYSPIWCSPGWTCASSGRFGGCCRASNCQLPTTCLDYTVSCGPSCLNDLGVTTCPSAAPYCANYHFGSSYTIPVCVYSPSVSLDLFSTATNGQVTLATQTTSTTRSSSTSATPSSTPTTPSTTGPVVTVTATPTGSSSGSSSSSSLSGGAIAGIVIGALVVIALVGGLIWFFRKKSKRDTSATNPSNQPPPSYQGGPGPMAPNPNNQWGQNEKYAPSATTNTNTNTNTVPYHDVSQPSEWGSSAPTSPTFSSYHPQQQSMMSPNTTGHNGYLQPQEMSTNYRPHEMASPTAPTYNAYHPPQSNVVRHELQ